MSAAACRGVDPCLGSSLLYIISTWPACVGAAGVCYGLLSTQQCSNEDIIGPPHVVYLVLNPLVAMQSVSLGVFIYIYTTGNNKLAAAGKI